MKKILKDAIVLFGNLSFNSNDWGWISAIVEWDEKALKYAWIGVEKNNGDNLMFQSKYRLTADKWYFYNELSIVESYDHDDSWILINQEGEELLKFQDGFPDDPTIEFIERYEEAVYLDLTYCHYFFSRTSHLNVQELNFGYQRQVKKLIDGTNKYYFLDDHVYWSSCEFNPLETEWQTIGCKSLEYDHLYNYKHDDGTCLVKDGNKFAIINRWFQRITPWFDDFLTKERLSELLDADAEIPIEYLSVVIEDEIFILEICGNFIHDKLLNPLSFFTDRKFGQELYGNSKLEFEQDDIQRIAVEDEYSGLNEFPDNIPFYVSYMNHCSNTDLSKFVKKHNQLMGITPSGYRIKQRFKLEQH